MTERADGSRRGAPETGTPGERLAGLAPLLDLEMPPFDGPLVAFYPGPEGAPGDPIYLGGDLHRVHPDASEQDRGRHRDHSLDEATITLTDHEHEELEVTAVTGVWCLALYRDQVDSAPYFTIWDTEGRLRIWLLLPPARLIIGL